MHGVGPVGMHLYGLEQYHTCAHISPWVCALRCMLLCCNPSQHAAALAWQGMLVKATRSGFLAALLCADSLLTAAAGASRSLCTPRTAGQLLAVLFSWWFVVCAQAAAAYEPRSALVTRGAACLVPCWRRTCAPICQTMAAQVVGVSFLAGTPVTAVSDLPLPTKCWYNHEVVSVLT